MSAGLAVGDALAPVAYRVTRRDLVRYAGASGDDNPLHWSDRHARAVGLPGVIAHGMYTLALAGRFATAVAGGDPSAVTGLSARFSRPVDVPDADEGTTVTVSATVAEVRDGEAVLTLTATVGVEPDAVRVLSGARAVVRLPAAG